MSFSVSLCFRVPKENLSLYCTYFCSLASCFAKYLHNEIVIAFIFSKMFFFPASGILTRPLKVSLCPSCGPEPASPHQKITSSINGANYFYIKSQCCSKQEKFGKDSSCLGEKIFVPKLARGTGQSRDCKIVILQD